MDRGTDQRLPAFPGQQVVGQVQPDVLAVLTAQHGVVAADPAREQRHALGRRRGARPCPHLERAEVDARQQLGSRLHAAECGIGAVIGHRAVVIDEAGQPHVLDALALARQHGEEHGLGYGQAAAAMKVDVRVAVRPASSNDRRSRGGTRLIDAELPGRRRPSAGAERHGRDLPLADRAQRHDEPDLAGRQPRLVGVEHRARVEQRGGLERIFPRSDRRRSRAAAFAFGTALLHNVGAV